MVPHVTELEIKDAKLKNKKIIESLMESNYVPMQARKDLTFY
jgi:hypothetical protein